MCLGGALPSRAPVPGKPVVTPGNRGRDGDPRRFVDLLDSGQVRNRWRQRLRLRYLCQGLKRRGPSCQCGHRLRFPGHLCKSLGPLRIALLRINHRQRLGGLLSSFRQVFPAHPHQAFVDLDFVRINFQDPLEFGNRPAQQMVARKKLAILKCLPDHSCPVRRRHGRGGGE
jgi:hypothetical protein